MYVNLSNIPNNTQVSNLMEYPTS